MRFLTVSPVTPLPPSQISKASIRLAPYSGQVVRGPGPILDDKVAASGTSTNDYSLLKILLARSTRIDDTLKISLVEKKSFITVDINATRMTPATLPTDIMLTEELLDHFIDNRGGTYLNEFSHVKIQDALLAAGAPTSGVVEVVCEQYDKQGVFVATSSRDYNMS